MKLWIALGRCDAVLGEQIAVFEIDRRVYRVAAGVDVDDLQVFADRAGLDLLPRDFDGCDVDEGRRESSAVARVGCEDAQSPAVGAGDRDLAVGGRAVGGLSGFRAGW